MGSTPTSSPIPWQPPPYDAYRDCSLGICTIYCPQWCTQFFPPPPDQSGSGTYFSPLVASVIVILASALLLVSYFTIFKKTCDQRRQLRSNSVLGDENHDRIESVTLTNALPLGLEESAISSIAVWKYKKGEGVVEGTDCSVCLSEFRDDERLRLLPKCNHAFHLPCIDPWLKSHSNCPLCRANVAPSVNSSPMQELPLGPLPPTVPLGPLPPDNNTGQVPTTAIMNELVTTFRRDDEIIITVFGADVLPSVAHVLSERHLGDGTSVSSHANEAQESRTAGSTGEFTQPGS
ncbi:hypothetical protein MLD38_037326 [Melastoma candidum]|uniref:Uncharacterized protein n=1 Tax=Melastoma candidum TaxID=119954 RepID=A0ACB9LM02_9MYRT|nr:hypothetical protein MLD38_037326 [Melastoma candidum]